MKSIYIDCSSGICGNMLLGALLDLGFPEEKFIEKIKEMKLNVDIEIKRVKRGSISALLVEVDERGNEIRRGIKEIFDLIDSSPFSDSVKEKGKKVFENLLSAEAKVHGYKLENAHLHEAGADDALVDILGTLYLIEELGIEEIISSPVNLGGGFVKSSHGELPVPAPAVGELLKNVPVYSHGSSELTTPTGSALLVSLAREFTPFPNFLYEKIGYGAGSREIEEFPNVLRVFLGKRSKDLEESILEIEFEVDDMDPQILGSFMDNALGSGALDIFYVPIYMKKNRPGVLVKIICRREDIQTLTGTIFSYTSTIGFRVKETKRLKMEREEKELDFKGEKIRVKISSWGDFKKFKPEYEDILSISEKTGRSVYEIMNDVIVFFKEKHGLKKD
jgi:uncharacterized protein (TIGR00299 family) protein